MTARRLLRLLVVLTTLLGPAARAAPTPARPAAADEPRSLSDVLTGEAKTHYDIARILYRDGDHASALAKFRRAHEISHDVRLLWNMAACEKNLRHYVKVLALIEQYVKEGHLDAPDLERALTFATAVRAVVGELTVRSEEPGAALTIDDEPAGTTPFDKALLVDGGRRKVRVTKAGFRPFERTIEVEGGTKQELAIVMEPEAGHLAIRARADDAIGIDDKVVGHGAWAGALAPGRHVVVVSARSGKSRRADVVLADRESRELTLETEQSAIPKWVWWVGGGALVAGAAVGGYFLFRPSREDAPTGTLGAYAVP